MGMTLYSNLFMGGAFVPILSLFVAELLSHGGKCCTMGGAPGFRDALPDFSLQQQHRLHMARLDMQNVFAIFPFKGTSPQPF